MNMTNRPKYIWEDHEYRRGARQALMMLHNIGEIHFDSRGRDSKPYNEAIYSLLMSDAQALDEWLLMGSRTAIRYSDHERDGRGRLIKVTAKIER